MAAARPRGELDAEQASLLEVIARGLDTAEALARAGLSPEQGLAALGSLELGGHIRREPGEGLRDSLRKPPRPPRLTSGDGTTADPAGALDRRL